MSTEPLKAGTGSQRLDASIQDWLAHGTELYDAAMSQYRALEDELEALEAQLNSKRAEVNQVAQLLGKPLAASYRRLSALAPDEERSGDDASSSPIRVMAGRFVRSAR